MSLRPLMILLQISLGQGRILTLLALLDLVKVREEIDVVAPDMNEVHVDDLSRDVKEIDLDHVVPSLKRSASPSIFTFMVVVHSCDFRLSPPVYNHIELCKINWIDEIQTSIRTLMRSLCLAYFSFHVELLWLFPTSCKIIGVVLTRVYFKDFKSSPDDSIAYVPFASMIGWYSPRPRASYNSAIHKHKEPNSGVKVLPFAAMIGWYSFRPRASSNSAIQKDKEHERGV
ncbi:hypothetical protein FNV43_RR20305 [Rhamnella rubrinervis]|uniref:Uncharacterized protein n=1 Tax=Rhamnella rubrinervis TaxID=2594499 RepID=A0A8K0E175_9ROSA|nr:hypothetical protein FNV43_RR20305 [Rhamnella rubrinervis]